jgi:hypothetical protein
MKPPKSKSQKTKLQTPAIRRRLRVTARPASPRSFGGGCRRVVLLFGLGDLLRDELLGERGILDVVKAAGLELQQALAHNVRQWLIEENSHSF